MTTDRIRDERGWALVTAILLMAVMLSTILGIATYLNGQTKLGADSRKRETAFNLAEAALNGQIFALSQDWPGAGYQTKAYGVCTQASTPVAAPAANHCPNAAAISQLIASPDSTGLQWQTEVHDNAKSATDPSGTTYYNEAVARLQPGYDANADGTVFVRASATARGKTRTMVTLVQVEPQTEDLPHAAVIANRLTDSNNGNKTIVNMTDSSGANGFIGVRCTPTLGESTACLAQPWTKDTFPSSLVTTNLSPYDGHVQPGYPTTSVVSPDQRARLLARAISDGTYYPTCPSALPSVIPGTSQPPSVIWIDSGNCKFDGNGVKQASVLVINNGTIEFTGTHDYYGVIYAINPSNSSGPVVMLHGNGHVYGGVLIEGDGTADVGSSGNTGGNLIFDDNAYKAVQTYGNAGIVQNTWREIPKT
jgi:Tfp pilus assembly protein PilX